MQLLADALTVALGTAAEQVRLRRRIEREQRARLEAEAIAEATTSRLYALVPELQSHRDVLVATSDLVVMLSAEGIDFLNQAALGFWGLTPDDVPHLDRDWLTGRVVEPELLRALRSSLHASGAWQGELGTRRPRARGPHVLHHRGPR